MSKTRRWVIILLSLVALVLIGVNLADRDDAQTEVVNTSEPTYKSDHSDTVVYSPEGALNYRLIAQHVEYFSDDGISWFTQPVMTTFDTDKTPTWSIKSDRAKLTNDRMLYLLRMRGNLRSKNAELIEKVRTSYEIQNKQTQP
ncbi:MAG: lptC [Enterobacter mori]|nr:lptC [Enterobacter mori]